MKEFDPRNANYGLMCMRCLNIRNPNNFREERGMTTLKDMLLDEFPCRLVSPGDIRKYGFDNRDYIDGDDPNAVHEERRFYELELFIRGPQVWLTEMNLQPRAYSYIDPRSNRGRVTAYQVTLEEALLYYPKALAPTVMWLLRDSCVDNNWGRKVRDDSQAFLDHSWWYNSHPVN